MGPKADPVTVTRYPTAAAAGDTLLMLGETLKPTPLLLSPSDVVTTTLPVTALPGTTATICVELQLAIIACVPLNVT